MGIFAEGNMRSETSSFSQDTAGQCFAHTYRCAGARTSYDQALVRLVTCPVSRFGSRWRDPASTDYPPQRPNPLNITFRAKHTAKRSDLRLMRSGRRPRRSACLLVALWYRLSSESYADQATVVRCRRRMAAESAKLRGSSQVSCLPGTSPIDKLRARSVHPMEGSDEPRRATVRSTITLPR